VVEDPLSEKLLWKEYTAGQTVIVDGRDGEIVLEPAVRLPDTPPVELAGSQES
jgi:hypothetical protein